MTSSSSVGLDIGTTSISAAIISHDKHTTIDSYTVPYRFNITATDPDLSEQDAVLIRNTVMELIYEIYKKHENISSIGVTGQMHGVLLIDKNGNAVTNLINWQDRRGERKTSDGITYCQRITEITGESVPTGYGFASLYYNYQNGIIPDTAHSFCSIMDFVVMGLTGNCEPVIHSSVAKSFGLFDDVSCSFMDKNIEKLEINIAKLPETTDDYKICGNYNGIPVSVAIGDNQASFLGSVKNIENSILLNIGTGSQISAVTDSHTHSDELEIRPLVKDKYIKCGSALCGGSAYALLEKFFAEYARAAGFGDDSQYDIINKLAYDAYENNKALTVNTCFKGKRSDPSLTGSVMGITVDNFTPGALSLGFLRGICMELYTMFKDNIGDKTTVVASGNAVQKIKILRDIISDIFSLPVSICSTTEEASVGAALFSAVAAGIISDVHEFSNYINYN